MLHYKIFSRQKPKISFAKELRSRQTPGEQALWRNLQSKRFHGLKFRRQVPVGPYIVDFLCWKKKLIIEVDGDSHYQTGAQKRDLQREDYLRNLGFTIFRCGNLDAVQATDSVLTRLAMMLGFPTDKPPLPCPLPSGEEKNVLS